MWSGSASNARLVIASVTLAVVLGSLGGPAAASSLSAGAHLTWATGNTINALYPEREWETVHSGRIGALSRVISPSDGLTGETSVSPDGSTIAFIRNAVPEWTIGAATLYVRRRGRAATRVGQGVISPAGRPMFSRNGRYLDIVDTDNRVGFYRYGIRSGRLTRLCETCVMPSEFDGAHTATAAVSVSPNGKYIGALVNVGFQAGLDSGQPWVVIWNLETGTQVAATAVMPVPRPSDSAPFDSTLAWSPNSRRLAFARVKADSMGSQIARIGIATLDVFDKVRGTRFEEHADTFTTSIKGPIYYRGMWYAFKFFAPAGDDIFAPRGDDNGSAFMLRSVSLHKEPVVTALRPTVKRAGPTGTHSFSLSATAPPPIPATSD